MSSSPNPNEKVKLWRTEGLDGLDLMRATYVHQRFPRHSHDRFAVGVIESGALGFSYRGENVVASQGAINLANPDEAHTGHAVTDTGWTYRMFYMDTALLQRAADEIAGRPSPYPFFQAGVIMDKTLAQAIHSLHRSLEAAETPLLEKETRLLAMLTGLILRHADAPPLLQPVGRERAAIRRVLAHMRENLGEDLCVEKLASVACLSPFHFIRVFGLETGLPPHTYLIQARVRRAQRLLARGRTIPDAALSTGFSDQSHLSRHFKRITGVTPGQYRRIVQDN
ncbi:MAG: AraC family transcriptional regulator [Desulfobacterales bacterium]|nr:AraC family transcriptional regulator [Desulfobacterales bacterium]